MKISNYDIISREDLQALFDEQERTGREFMKYQRRLLCEDGSVYIIWLDTRTGKEFAEWEPRTVHFGLNSIPEDKVQELVEILEHEGEARASWGCDGRTRHHMLTQQLAAMLPQYSFDIDYNYKCNVSKR